MLMATEASGKETKDRAGSAFLAVDASCHKLNRHSLRLFYASAGNEGTGKRRAGQDLLQS